MLSRRATRGTNRLSGIDGLRSSSPSAFDCPSSSDKLGSNGLVVCCCGCGAVGCLGLGANNFFDEAFSGSIESLFSHFHLLDFGGRCNGGL